MRSIVGHTRTIGLTRGILENGFAKILGTENTKQKEDMRKMKILGMETTIHRLHSLARRRYMVAVEDWLQR